MSYFLGIDPGMSGAIAIIDRNHQNLVHTIEYKKQPEKEIGFLVAEKASFVRFACLEAVHAFPGQGVSTTFTFGANFGFYRGLLAALQIEYALVSPMKWQRTLGCLTRGDKNVTKMLARELFPTAKVTHQNADAILLAHYCVRLYGGLDHEPYRQNNNQSPIDKL